MQPRDKKSRRLPPPRGWTDKKRKMEPGAWGHLVGAGVTEVIQLLQEWRGRGRNTLALP